MDVENAEYNTRFKSFVLDFNDFLDNPFFGLGRAEETRFKGITDHKLNHRNNGVSNYLATYGLFAFVFYFFLIYSTFRYTCKYYSMNKPYYAFFGLLLIWFIGFSEDYFNYPFFIGLTMAHIGYPLEPEVNKIV